MMDWLLAYPLKLVAYYYTWVDPFNPNSSVRHLFNRLDQWHLLGDFVQLVTVKLPAALPWVLQVIDTMNL